MILFIIYYFQSPRKMSCIVESFSELDWLMVMYNPLYGATDYAACVMHRCDRMKAPRIRDNNTNH